jgi:hypothetical protein
MQESGQLHVQAEEREKRLDIKTGGDYIFFSLALQPPWALAPSFQFHDHVTHGRTPWTGDQLVARPLPTHRKTQTQNKYIKTKEQNPWV